MNQNQSLSGEIALVTGASRGIGAAIADELAKQGAIVIGTATTEAGAAAIGERLAAQGGAGRALDVTDGAAVEALIDAIGKEFGTISILVNNAGITRDNLLMRMKDEDWQAILDTNLSSVYRTCKAVMRSMMKARRGRIVNIASVVGVTGNAGQANYAAAKAGIIGFSKSLAREIGSRNITVNVGESIPSFWFALMLMLLFAVTLGVLPSSGYVRNEILSLGTLDRPSSLVIVVKKCVG